MLTDPQILQLPRVAPGYDLRRADRANPWAGLTAEIAEEGLREAVIAPGRPHLYSNFGYQLLGLVLERATGQPYQTLIAERLLSPLAMTCSGMGRHGGGTPLPGHAGGREVPHRDHPVPGPGGVEATIGDLARYAGLPLPAADTARRRDPGSAGTAGPDRFGS